MSTYHTVCTVLLICFWIVVLYTHAYPQYPRGGGGRSPYGGPPSPRGYYPERPVYRRQASPYMDQYEEPMYPPYRPRPRSNDGSNLIVLPRGADEEYEMYPLKTKMLDGFDQEDEDMIHEEELGDALTLIDKQAPTRFIPEGVVKKPKPAPSFQMEMSTQSHHTQPPSHHHLHHQQQRPYPSQSPMMLPQHDEGHDLFPGRWMDDLEEPPMYPPHYQQKRYQPNYQYYHDYFQPRYMEPEPMYQSRPRGVPMKPKRKPTPKITPSLPPPPPSQVSQDIYDLEDIEDELPVYEVEVPLMDDDSEEDDIMMPVIPREEVIETEEEDSMGLEGQGVIPFESMENDDEDVSIIVERVTVMPPAIMTMKKKTQQKGSISMSESTSSASNDSTDEMMQDTGSNASGSTSSGDVSSQEY